MSSVRSRRELVDLRPVAVQSFSPCLCRRWAGQSEGRRPIGPLIEDEDGVVSSDA